VKFRRKPSSEAPFSAKEAVILGVFLFGFGCIISHLYGYAPMMIATAVSGFVAFCGMAGIIPGAFAYSEDPDYGDRCMDFTMSVFAYGALCGAGFGLSFFTFMFLGYPE
jgi:hypothetical protein